MILLSPSDIVLGEFVKIVYIHGALVWVSIILFFVVGFTSITYIIFRNKNLEFYLSALSEIAIIFWIVSTLLGIIVSYVVWHGIIWNEPRLTTTIVISILAVVMYIISIEYWNPLRNAILGTILSLSVLILLTRIGNFFHPENPIMQSNFRIQLTFILLVGIFIIIAFQLVIMRLKFNR